jgi:hypothetical protein
MLVVQHPRPSMDRRLPSRPRPEQLPPGETRALVACALWLHVAYVGGVTALAGIATFGAGEFGWARMLALVVVCGALLAAAGLRRARDVLNRAAREPAVPRAKFGRTAARLVAEPGRG